MKNVFYGLFVAALLTMAPQAFAGYWSGHSEIDNSASFSTDPVHTLRDFIINMWLEHHGE